MTAPTADAPTAAGDVQRSTRRQSAAALLGAIAQGRRLEIVHSNGLTYLTDVPSCDDAALLRAASDLALLSQVLPPCAERDDMRTL